MNLLERFLPPGASSFPSLQMKRSRKRTRSEASCEVTTESRPDIDFDSDTEIDFNRLARKRKPKKLDSAHRDAPRQEEKPQEKVKDEKHHGSLGASVVKKAKLAITHFFSSSSSSVASKEPSEVSMSNLTIKPGKPGNEKRDLDFAGLDNVGNTCFVNSCLYALRFMPEFPAVMHSFYTKTLELKKKENVDISDDASKAAILVMNLHDVFHQLRKREIANAGKKNPDTFRPMAFVEAFHNSQPSYEKGEQFDAQEFLSHLLNTMSVLSKELQRIEAEEAEKQRVKLAEAAALKARGRLARRRKGSAEDPNLPSAVNPWALSKGESFFKSMVKSITHHGQQSNGEVEGGVRKSLRKRKSVDYGEQFIVSNPISKKEVPSVAKLCDYQDTHMTGTCVVSMTCLDCEEATSVEEHFTSIAVPVACGSNEDPVKFFDRLKLEEELITDDNKIFCRFCNTRQEGRRTVTYASLPRVLVLHLKRFSTFFNSRTARVESEKATDYLSTPTSIPCFCSQCNVSLPGEHVEDVKEAKRPHPDYQLHGIVEHQGSISCGHYVAYCRLPPASFNTSVPSVKKRRNSSENEINPLDCCFPAALDESSDRSWVRCDDCVISRLSEEDVMKVLGDNGPKAITPYLLLYVRASR